MKNMLVMALLFFMAIYAVNAQTSLNNYLQSVKAHNKLLQSATDYYSAKKIEATTNLTPENPEFEFGHYPGNSDAIGTKQVLGISQTIEFPLNYVYKNKLAEKTNDKLSLDYKMLEQAVLLDARKTWCQVVYRNKLAINFDKRSNDASKMVDFYLKKQQNGDATQLEVNKARLFLLNIQNNQRLNTSYLKQNRQKLRQLNGGIIYDINDTLFENPVLTDWLLIKAEIDSVLPELKQSDIAEQVAAINLKLNKSAWLPNIMLGYESEEVLSDKYSGIKAGFSIPLWQNKNSVNAAKAELVYAKSNAENKALQIESSYYQIYIEAEALHGNLQNFNANMQEMNNEYLLSRSLELGQISAIEYFMELDYFYNISDKLLELELMYQLSLAELYKFKL